MYQVVTKSLELAKSFESNTVKEKIGQIKTYKGTYYGIDKVRSEIGRPKEFLETWIAKNPKFEGKVSLINIETEEIVAGIDKEDDNKKSIRGNH